MSLDYLKWSSLLVFLEGLSVNLMILAVWRVLYCCTLLSMVKMESMTVEDVAEWLKDHGFGDDVQEAFRDQCMDGEALVAAFGVHPGPDCLKDVLPRFGQRVKVYNVVKSALGAAIRLEEEVVSVEETSESDCASTDILSASTRGTRGGSSAPISPAPSCGTPVQSTSKKRPRNSFSVSPKSPLSPLSPPTTSSTPCRTVVKVPEPFPIPQFKETTQKHLDEKTFDSSDRTYIVRTLATILLTYVSRPSMKDCEKVAKSLVLKYSFLKEHHSWQQFLYVRCQNTNRKPRPVSMPMAKRAKADVHVLQKHSYPSLTADTGDEVAYERNVAALKDHMSKNKLNQSAIQQLLRRTFYRRRLAILDDPNPKSVKEITEMFPALRKLSFISFEMGMITQTENIEQHFNDEWKKYVHLILKYALSHESPSKDLRHALRNFEPYEDDEVHELTESDHLTCVRILGTFLIKTRKREEIDPKVDILHLLVDVVKGTPQEEAIDVNNNYPHIIKFTDGDADIPSQYFICVEQALHVECKGIISALFTLMAIHYIFNIEYHPKIRDLLYFVQEKMLGLQDDGRKSSAQYLSFSTAISCMQTLN